jgi:hypothetical protein
MDVGSLPVVPWAGDEDDAMIRRCAMPECNSIIVIGRGAADTNRCLEHQGQRATESDEERMERVCREMGWRRTKR